MSKLTTGEQAIILAYAEGSLKNFIHKQTDFESAFCMGELFGMMFMASRLEDWELYGKLDEIEQRRRDYRHGRKVLR